MDQKRGAMNIKEILRSQWAELRRQSGRETWDRFSIKRGSGIRLDDRYVTMGVAGLQEGRET